MNEIPPNLFSVPNFKSTEGKLRFLKFHQKNLTSIFKLIKKHLESLLSFFNAFSMSKSIWMKKNPLEKPLENSLFIRLKNFWVTVQGEFEFCHKFLIIDEFSRFVMLFFVSTYNHTICVIWSTMTHLKVKFCSKYS